MGATRTDSGANALAVRRGACDTFEICVGAGYGRAGLGVAVEGVGAAGEGAGGGAGAGFGDLMGLVG